jgi:hypothetical protein
MRSTIRATLVILLFFNFSLLSAQSSDSVKYYQESIEIVELDHQALENFRGDSDFNYLRSEARYSNWFAQFLGWVQRVLRSFFGSSGTSTAMEIGFYLLALVGIVLLIVRLAGVQFSTLVRRATTPNSLNDLLADEDIHQLDFDQLLKKSVEAKNYREAVRWIYLFALRKLSDRELIQWTPGKTNHDYLNELSATPFGRTFQNLSYYFEYIWYGNFDIPPNLYTKVETAFQDLTDQLKQNK